VEEAAVWVEEAVDADFLARMRVHCSFSLLAFIPLKGGLKRVPFRVQRKRTKRKGTGHLSAFSTLRSLFFAIFLCAAATLATGCAVFRGPAQAPLVTHLEAQDEAGECARYFEALDQAVDKAGVADRQARCIPGFPYLRVDRFLASFADQNLEEESALADWLDRLQALDHEARKEEIANLPAASREGLRGPAGETDLQQAVANCGDLLRNTDLAAPENRRLLQERADVSPNYSTAKSILGLYPLTALFVRLGISHYHRSIMETYGMELARLPVAGHLVRYVPSAGGPSAAEAGLNLERAARDRLGIPVLSADERARLFLAFAPVWEIDTSGDFDRPGTPYWPENTLPSVDPDRLQVYTLVSHTRFGGEVLLQLNYVIWFPERPLQGTFDLFGGRLDGLIWRVTLGRHGEPLIYDTIHNCGCYHMFFPGPELIARPQSVFTEPLLIPQRAPVLAGNRMVIRVASRTHYIDRIYADVENAEEQAVTYDFADYNQLRSLPVEGDGRRSLFGEDAIVPGSERSERWLLWPTGVPSPGAMRQWGNHATAFFGRRHFDDADLLERLFAPVNPTGR
jgi:hypothetical protein